MAKMPKVPVLSKFEHRQFTQRFLKKRRPVVYAGYAKRWPALRSFSPAALAERFGARKIPVSLGRGAPAPVALNQFIATVLSAKPGQKVPYLRNVFLNQHLPELLDAVRWPKLATPNWLRHELLSSYLSESNAEKWFELFISAPTTSFPAVHVDEFHTHAWLLQLHGEKTVWVWPDEAADPAKGNRQLKDGENIEHAFHGHAPAKLTLRAGDLLFIPFDTWHAAESATVSVTLSGNWVERTNWSAFFSTYFEKMLVDEASRDALIARSIDHYVRRSHRARR